MKRFTRITATLLVAICTVAMATGTRTAIVATQPQPQKDERREKLQRLKIQDFRGEAASLRARQLRKERKGVARAMKDAETRGLRQAFGHGRVIVGTDPAETDQTAAVTNSRPFPKSAGLTLPLSFKSRSHQDTFVESDYEITFIPYDDGDPNTWEGIIYRYNPDFGDDTRYAVIDIHTDQPEVAQEILYPSDGGDPQPLGPGDLIISKSSAGPQSRGCSAAQALTPRYREVKLTKWAGMGPPCPSGWKPCLRLRDECCSPPPNLGPWINCTGKGCLGAAAGCSRTGPIFGECWGSICTGAMLMCLL